MPAEEHALLGASSAKQWLNCPPSIRLCENLPEKPSKYADEGHLAHELAELALRKHYTTPMGPKKYAAAVAAARDAYYKPLIESGEMKLEERKADEKAMDNYVAEYFDLISQQTNSFSHRPFVGIEQRVDFSRYVPGGFGTADTIIIGDGVMILDDFKYGQGVPVDAEDNPQLKLYALGALDYFGMLYPIERVQLTICQPRLNSISAWETTADELRAWGESIKPIAQDAWDGLGEFKAGDHCKFCKAKATCRTRADQHTALEDFGYQKPPLLTDKEVGQALIIGEKLADWLKALSDYALETILAGGMIPGWKAVEGRSNRKIEDVDAAFKAAIGAGQPETMLYKRQPITLTELEKLMGKKPFEEVVGPYVVKPPGAPTLALETDKRPAVSRGTTAADDFAADDPGSTLSDMIPQS